MYTKFIVSLLVLSALVFSACGGDEPPPATDPVMPQEEPVAPVDEPMQDEELAAPEADDELAIPANGDVIPIELGATDIQVPAAVPAGLVEFQVTNTNDVEMGFGIEGAGVLAELPNELAPGETDVLMVDIAPGEYTVYSYPADQPDQITTTTISVSG
jgi:hypothetical protein